MKEIQNTLLHDAGNGDEFLEKLADWLAASAYNMNISGTRQDVYDAVDSLRLAAGRPEHMLHQGE